MSDLRRVQRAPALQKGKAVLNNGRAAVNCTIRDLSPLGARLSFTHPTFLPRKFNLVFDEGDQTVTVIWQAGLLAGVRFQTPLHAVPNKPQRRSWFGLRG